jgi:EAL domain-containing protein (putative c-di-GMP-specific phosphodiesterase class I)
MPLTGLEHGAGSRADHLPHDSLADHGLTDAAAGALQADLAHLVAAACTLARADFGAVYLLDAERETCVAASDSALLATRPRLRSRTDRILQLVGGPFVTTDAAAEPIFAGLPTDDAEPAPAHFYVAVPLIGLDGAPFGVLSVWSARIGAISEPVLRVLEELAGRVTPILVARRASAIPPDERPATGGADPTAHKEWNIDAVIAERAVRTLFQPIVHLPTGATVGFKAISCGPVDSRLESPAALMDEARKVGRLGELDWLCRVQAMEAARNAAGLHPSLSWFIDVAPESLGAPCPEHLVPALAQAALDLRVILDIASSGIESHVAGLTRLVDQSRRNTWGVALRDVGRLDAPTALHAVLEPDVVRVPVELLTDSASDMSAASALTTLASQGHQGQATLLVEGITTAQQARTAMMFGAEYGQGDHFGQPTLLPEHVAAPRHVVPLRKPFMAQPDRTPFEMLSDVLPAQRATRDEMRPISEYVERFALVAQPSSIVLANLEHGSQFSDAKQSLFCEIALANTVTVVMAGDADDADNADNADNKQQAGLQVLPTPARSRFANEWSVIVLSPSDALAFSASTRGFGRSLDGKQQLDYVLTHDRDLVIRAARRFLQEAAKHANAAWFGEAPESEPEPEPDSAPGLDGGPSTNSRNLRRGLFRRRGHTHP